MRRCPYCFEDTNLNQDPRWGLICCDCHLEMSRIEKETDWDTWEVDRHQYIAPTNEPYRTQEFTQ
ncbi:hypothetical protein TUM4438_45070 [Shewanella sairae]|uniref:Uncharacterized protein n=1 Tax=Shewanella sairae TaxID=190310 RepID=A0ABQ4PRX3_9GAMM|nr:hypothetical protein [Shewanella sairae]MCL1132586.1 hypothetical protein [Shewanella sairae]GIU52410.1 hypothetical protein TUM4438_45070 [Shewanella sairae]